MTIKQADNVRIKLLHFLVFVDTAEHAITDVILSWSFFISPCDGGIVYKVHRCIENECKDSGYGKCTQTLRCHFSV